MLTTIQRHYSLDEYRAIANTSEEKCEYHDGEIVTMTGGTVKHSRIGGNVFALLKFLLRDTNFEAINNDLRLWIPDYRRGVRFLMFFYLFIAEFYLCATSKYFDLQFDFLFVLHYLEYCTDKIFERTIYHFYAFTNDE